MRLPLGQSRGGAIFLRNSGSAGEGGISEQVLGSLGRKVDVRGCWEGRAPKSVPSTSKDHSGKQQRQSHEDRYGTGSKEVTLGGLLAPRGVNGRQCSSGHQCPSLPLDIPVCRKTPNNKDD